MTRHQRLGLLLLLASLALAVSAFSADKARVASKGSTNKNQASPQIAPVSTKTLTATPVPTTIGTVTSTSAPLYKLDWYSINGGGAIDASSADYKMGLSVGQPVAGTASSATYQMGIGFWYGAGGCSCPSQGDINGDLGLDVFDVIAVIDIAFSGFTEPRDPSCPTGRGDVNNDGSTDVFDLIYLIAAAFSGGPLPVDPCI
jgi:hypothetical protein